MKTYILIIVEIQVHTKTMQAVMKGMRLDFSATMSRVGCQRVVPVSPTRPFRLRVNSTQHLGSIIVNSRVVKQIAVQSAKNRREPRDLSSEASTHVAAILGRFTLPVVISLVCTYYRMQDMVCIACLES